MLYGSVAYSQNIPIQDKNDEPPPVCIHGEEDRYFSKANVKQSSVHQMFEQLNQYIDRVTIDPLVIRNNGETFTLTLTTKEDNIEEISIRFIVLILHNGKSQELLNFNKIGPKTFQIENLHIELAEGMGWRESTLWVTELNFIEKSGKRFSTEHNFHLIKTARIIDANLITDLNIEKINEHVYKTDHVVNFVNKRKRAWRTRTNSDEFYSYGDSFEHEHYNIEEFYYQIFEDDRDFLITKHLAKRVRFINYQFDGIMNLIGSYGNIKNDTEGIGRRISDNAHFYGSNSVLQGRINLYGNGLFRNSNPFTTLNHEFLHRWAVFIDQYISRNYGNDEIFNFQWNGAHWTMSNDFPSSGFGYSFGRKREYIKESDGKYWVKNITAMEDCLGSREDRFSVGSTLNCEYFNDFELYLMGLKDADVVDGPFKFFPSSSLSSTGVSEGDYTLFEASEEPRILEIHDIKEYLGPRVPSAEHSQKDFKTALIIPYDRPLSKVEFAFFELIMSEYAKPKSNHGLTFEHAARGKATMDTRIGRTLPVPQSPVAVTPENQSVNQPTSVTLSWSIIDNANGYRVQFSDDPDFQNLILDKDLVEDEYSVSDLIYKTTYYWRVKSYNMVGESNWSNTYYFTTVVEDPDFVELISPDNGAIEISTNPNFEWESSDRAENYTIQISTDENFAHMTVDTTVAESSISLSESLITQTVHYWRVRAENVGGFSNWSPIWHFTTIVDEITFNPIYPNPFEGQAVIEYTLNESTDVTIEVFDISGRRIKRKNISNQPPGIHNQTLDGSNFASGIYFVRLQAADFDEVQKVTIIK